MSIVKTALTERGLFTSTTLSLAVIGSPFLNNVRVGLGKPVALQSNWTWEPSNACKLSPISIDSRGGNSWIDVITSLEICILGFSPTNKEERTAEFRS